MSEAPPTVAAMPSPMRAVNIPSDSTRTPPTPEAVEVYVDDVQDLPAGWYFGQLRHWAHFPDIGWTATVQWSRPGKHGDNQHLDRFLAEHIREDTVDRSHGRGA